MSSNPLQVRPFLGTCALLALVSCTSKAAFEGPRLPFSIALLPIRSLSNFAELPEDTEGLTNMTLTIDTTSFTDQLATGLEEVCFVRADTVLPPDTGEEGQLDQDASEVKLVRAALASGADLILECKLQYSPSILCERTVFGGVGWFLFALGGPFGILLEEHTYYADVVLHATFYDAAMIYDAEMDSDEFLSEWAKGRVVGFDRTFPGIALDMIDRADGPGDYAMALIMPAGYIATESESLQVTIHEDVLSSLSQQVASRVLQLRASLIRSSGKEAGVFAFDPDQFAIDQGIDGKIKISGQVRLFPSPVVDRMDAYRISMGAKGEGEWVDFKDVDTPDPGTDTEGSSKLYRIDDCVLQSSDAETLKLELRAGSRDRYIRSYTFPLEPRTLK